MSSGNRMIYSFLTCFIAAVWVLNGLYCKVLGAVPRHERIVAEILGSPYAKLITVAIGFSEVALAVWFLSKYKQKENAYLQMVLVMLMNVIEIVATPQLLLWGRFNIIFALGFIALVYYHTFVLREQFDLKIDV